MLLRLYRLEQISKETRYMVVVFAVCNFLPSCDNIAGDFSQKLTVIIP